MAYKKGKRVEEGIWRLADSKEYLAEVTCRDPITRQRVRERKTTNRLEIARAWIDSKKGDAVKGEIKRKKKVDPVLFKAFAEEYLKAWGPEKKPGTTKREEIRVRGSLVPYFGEMPLHTITRKHIEDFITKRRQCGKRKKTGVSAATANRELDRLSSMLKRAAIWGYIDASPTIGLKHTKEQREEAAFLGREEVARLLDACPERIRPLMIVAVNTGMRWGELMALEWRDVDFERRFITVRDPKNRETRHVPMNVAVGEALESHRRWQAGEVGGIISYVFANPETKKPLVNIKRPFGKALRDAEITRHFTFHGLRHTAASHMVMAGVDIRTVGKILGHKTAQITLRYAHLAPDHLKGAVDRLDFTASVQEGKAGGEAQ